jgi:hypothetical protein
MTSPKLEKISEIVGNWMSGSKETVFLVNGIFGSGKSEFVEDLCKEITNNNLTDSFIRFNFESPRNYLLEYFPDLEIQFTNDDSAILKYDFNESLYNRNRFLQLSSELASRHSDEIDRFLKQRRINRFPAKIEESDNKLNDILERNSDKRLLLKYNRTISESLIADFLNLIYQQGEEKLSFSEIKERIVNPFRITFIIDNFDNISFSVFDWLNAEMLELVHSGKLADFTSYAFEENDKAIFVNELLDIKFIISSRVNPIELDYFKWFTHNSRYIRHIEIEVMDYSETDEYAKSKGLDDENVIKKIYEFSHGIPYLIDLLFRNSEDEINEITRDNCYQIFTSKFLDSEDKVFADATQFASVINKAGIQYLECNKKIKSLAEETYEKLKFSNDIFSVNDDALIMAEPIKTIVKKATERNNKAQYLEYQYIQKIVDTVGDRFSKYNSEEIKILRALAYFKNFDLEHAVPAAFDDKAKTATDFIIANKDLFKKGKSSYSFDSDSQSILSDYNRLTDREKFELKQQLISKIWNDRKSELTDEMTRLKDTVKEQTAEHESLTINPAKYRTDYDTHQRMFIENENELIILKKQLTEFSLSRHVSSFFITLVAGVLSFVVAYFFPTIFMTSQNQSSVEIIQYSLFGLSLVFLFIAMSTAFKMIKISSNKKGKRSITDKIAKIQKENDEHQLQMNSLRDLSMNGQKQAKELFERIENNQKRIKEIEELLTEPYI